MFSSQQRCIRQWQHVGSIIFHVYQIYSLTVMKNRQPELQKPSVPVAGTACVCVCATLARGRLSLKLLHCLQTYRLNTHTDRYQALSVCECVYLKKIFSVSFEKSWLSINSPSPPFSPVTSCFTGGARSAWKCFAPVCSDFLAEQSFISVVHSALQQPLGPRLETSTQHGHNISKYNNTLYSKMTFKVMSESCGDYTTLLLFLLLSAYLLLVPAKWMHHSSDFGEDKISNTKQLLPITLTNEVSDVHPLMNR